jgi:hypothetical protein
MQSTISLDHAGFDHIVIMASQRKTVSKLLDGALRCTHFCIKSLHTVPELGFEQFTKLFKPTAAD